MRKLSVVFFVAIMVFLIGSQVVAQPNAANIFLVGNANGLPGEVVDIPVIVDVEDQFYSVVNFRFRVPEFYNFVGIKNESAAFQFSFSYGEDFYEVSGYCEREKVQFYVQLEIPWGEQVGTHEHVRFYDIFLNGFEMENRTSNILVNNLQSFGLSFWKKGFYTLSFPADPQWGCTFEFPASWPAFEYDRGYKMVSRGGPGKGYMVFVTFQTGWGIYGIPVNFFSIEVKEGWNLIPAGSQDQPLPIFTDPPGILDNQASILIAGNYSSTDTIPCGYAGFMRGFGEGIAYIGFPSVSPVTPPYQTADKGSRKIVALKKFNQNFGEKPPMPEVNAGVLASYQLAKNYPNPFNAITKIDYTLTDVGRVSIKVYDILGRLVEALTEEVLMAGDHSVFWNARNAVSGVYLYQIQFSGSTQYTYTGKMMLIK